MRLVECKEWLTAECIYTLQIEGDASKVLTKQTKEEKKKKTHQISLNTPKKGYCKVISNELQQQTLLPSARIKGVSLSNSTIFLCGCYSHKSKITFACAYYRRNVDYLSYCLSRFSSSNGQCKSFVFQRHLGTWVPGLLIISCVALSRSHNRSQLQVPHL